MKKLLALVALMTAIHANAASVCPEIEFAELQTYSDKELSDLWKEYVLLQFEFIDVGNGRRMMESENCKTQVARIQRIRHTRIEKEAAANKAASK